MCLICSFLVNCININSIIDGKNFILIKYIIYFYIYFYIYFLEYNNKYGDI